MPFCSQRWWRPWMASGIFNAVDLGNWGSEQLESGMHSQARSILTPCVYSVWQLKQRKLRAEAVGEGANAACGSEGSSSPWMPGPRGPAGAKANACWTQKAHGDLSKGACGFRDGSSVLVLPPDSWRAPSLQVKGKQRGFQGKGCQDPWAL